MKRARNKSILDSVLIEMSSEPTPRRSPRKAGDDLREESHRDHVSEHPSHGANTGDTTAEPVRVSTIEREDHKLAPFDEHTDPAVWITHVAIIMGDLPDKKKILNALNACRGSRMAWTSSMTKMPQTWPEFVQAFHAYFIEGTEHITDEHRLIRKAREIRKWDREELTILKQLATRAKLSEIQAIRAIAIELNEALVPKHQTVFVRTWDELDALLSTLPKQPTLEVMATMANTRANTSRIRPARPGPNYECWSCGQFGVHWKNECPANRGRFDRGNTERSRPPQQQNPYTTAYGNPQLQYPQQPPYYGMTQPAPAQYWQGQQPAMFQPMYQPPIPQQPYPSTIPQQVYQPHILQQAYQPPIPQQAYQPPIPQQVYQAPIPQQAYQVQNSLPYPSTTEQQVQHSPQSPNNQPQMHYTQTISSSAKQTPQNDGINSVGGRFMCTRVDVRVNGHKSEAIVDTGANVVAISRLLARKARLKITPWKTEVKTASGEPAPVFGIAFGTPITIGITTRKFDCLVMDTSSFSILLGTNALCEFGAVIDMLKQELTVDGNAIPLKTFIGKQPTAMFEVSTPITLPAFSETTVEVCPGNPDTFKENQLYHLTTVKTGFSKNGIVVAQGIFDKEHIPKAILIANVTDHPINIPIQTTIATAYEQEPIATPDVNDENQNEVTWPDLSKLTQERRDMVERLLRKYPQLCKPITPGTATHNVELSIPLKDDIPIRSGPYRNSRFEDDAILPDLEELLRKHFIEESNSQYASPILLVPKKDGKIRLCVDYRKLNAKTVKEIYPMPRIDDTLDRLHGAKIFSSLDLKSGYWQVPIAEADRHKSAFITKYGLYQWTCMPFGLCNAPATFQRLMDGILRGLNWQCCLVYLDDIIVYSKNLKEHEKHLEQVFMALTRANLRLNPAKCRFAEEEINYLGHRVNKDGIQPDQAKIEPITKLPTPQNTHDIRALLGMLGYYRRFIKNFATVAEPLTRLLKANTKFEWGTEQEQAKAMLLRAIISEPILAYPDFSKTFIIQTDASDVGVGAVLSQMQDGLEHPIGYASETLDSVKRNYSATEKEAYAIYWAVNHFRPYIYGRKFQLQTDHKALEYIFNGKTTNQKLLRWALSIQEFNFEVSYKRGSQNGNADCLSRMVVNMVDEPSSYRMVKKRLHYGARPVPPKDERIKLIREYHEATVHGGKEALLKMLAERYYWNTMEEDVDKFKRACPICQSFNTPPSTPSTYTH